MPRRYSNTYNPRNSRSLAPYRKTNYNTRYSNTRSNVNKYSNQYSNNKYPMYKNLSQNLYPVVRHVNIGNILSEGPATVIDDYFIFQLNQVPGSTELQAMYQRYRICMVKIYFIPISNVTLGSITDGSSTGQEPGTAYNRRLYTAIDYNDIETITLTNIRQYKTCKWAPNNKVHKRVIYTKQAPNSDGVQAPTGGCWVDTTNPAYGFRGLLYVIEAPNVPIGTALYTVEAKYYMMFKDPK